MLTRALKSTACAAINHVTKQSRRTMITSSINRFSQQPKRTSSVMRQQAKVLAATAGGAAVCPVNHGAMKSMSKYQWDIIPDDDYQRKAKANEAAIRKAIEAVAEDDDYDGIGSYLPLFIRLAWHASGTADIESKTGGSNGGCIRFRGEKDEGRHGANNGLDLAIERLKPVKEQFAWLSWADLITFSGFVAAEKLSEGEVKVPYTFGRRDYKEGSHYVVDRIRLPDATKDQTHVRNVFTKQMGFSDREIVALLGAHAVGGVHLDRSGFGMKDEDGNSVMMPWTTQPLNLGHHYYTTLLNEKWTPKYNAAGNIQFENETGNLMMLPAEYVLIVDPEFRKVTEEYAKDKNTWAKDFSAAFGKLLDLGRDFE